MSDRSIKILVMTLSTICLLLIVFLVIAVTSKSNRKVFIPNVENLSIEEATNKLIEAGLTVNPIYQQQNSDTIVEGNVIGTIPAFNQEVEKKTEITFIVSKGPSGFILEDYTGKNSYEIAALLKEKNINVQIEKQDVEGEYKMGMIVSQSPQANERVKEGGSVTLIIPNIEVYPDFTDGTWNIESVESFCEEYTIELNIDYQESDEYTPGTIIEQSILAGSELTPGSLTIYIAKEISTDME